MKRTPWTRMLALAPIAALAGVIGCSGDGIDNSKREPHASVATPASLEPTQAAPAVHVAQAETPAKTEAEPAVAKGGLPPDLEVSVPDTLVMPGQSVEFTVEATQDVTELVLWDGLNNRQAFTRDADSGVWQVTYRVPLRPKTDRIGIAVTARNDDQRWRRRWVFLRVVESGCLDLPIEERDEEGCAGC